MMVLSVSGAVRRPGS